MKPRNLKMNAKLQKVLRYLRGALKRGDGSVTGRDIVIRCNVTNANGIIEELRANGCEISCKRRDGTDGKPRWHYRLEKEPEHG